MQKIEIERQEFVCIDDLEVVSIDDIQYEVSVLDVECGIATVSVNVNCIVKVWYDFTDENQSYWDKEEQGLPLADGGLSWRIHLLSGF